MSILAVSASSFPIWTLLTLTLFLAKSRPAMASEPQKVVIAHRGASGYLPEHTLAGKALAYGMGAHFIEQDLVLTKDDQPVVLHDIYLDTVTDVATVFPDRRRDDGRYYAIDLSLAEIKTLRVSERIELQSGTAVFTGRFPVCRMPFQVPTLVEEIELVQGLNKSTGRDVGIYPEIKSPAWHRAQGKDISRIVLQVLQRSGYRNKSDNVFLQCFDANELQRIRHELDCHLRLVQLIGANEWNEAATDFDRLRTSQGLQEIAQYADGIGPWLPQVVPGKDNQGRLRISELVHQAHRHGLLVHPYTLRADQMPDYANSFEELLRIVLVDADADGVFTDFPDRVRTFIRQLSSATSQSDRDSK